MLTWSIAFLVLAVIAAIFGFAGIAAAAAGIGKVLFFIFLFLFIGSLLLRFAKKADREVEKSL